MAAKPKEMLAVIGISAVVDKTMDKAVDAAQKKISKINPKALKVATAIGGISTATFKVGKVLAKMGSEYQKTMGQLQAKTGASAKDMEKLGEIVQGVYKNNFGESMDDVADSVAEVQRIMKLSGTDLQGVTQDAIALRDVFGYDVSESARAAEAMVKNFGISGKKAYNLLAAGAQNGLDYSGEFLDSISEYSVQFKKQGMSADQMFHVLQAGADAGAWSLDKISDAVKENAIRAIDLSDSSVGAFSKIGLDAEKIGAKFAAGGKTANKAFNETIKKIGELKDPLEQDAVGVALFGTMWEDLSKEAVFAMADVSKAAYGTGKEMENLQKAKYTNLQDAFQGIGRVIEVTVLPYAQKLANYIAGKQPQIEAAVQAIINKIKEIAPIVRDVAIGISDNFGLIVAAVVPFGVALGALKIGKFISETSKMIETLKDLKLKTKLATAATKIASGAQKVWNAVQIAGKAAARGLGKAIHFFTTKAGVWVLIASAIIAAGIAVYKNWDTIKAVAVKIAKRIKSVFVGMKNGVVKAFTTMRDKIAGVFGGLKELVKKPINAVIGLVNKAIDGINDLKAFEIAGKEIQIGADIPHIPKLERGGLTQGPSIAGEGRYPEMVISQDPRWRSENLGYLRQASQMLGADRAEGYSLGGSMSSVAVDMGMIEYKPVININGQANKSDILEALEEDRENFKDMLLELFLEIEEFAYV